MIELRDYQDEALERVRANMRNDVRAQILCAPTGAGKTIIASAVINAAARKLSRCTFLAPREALVFQASRRLLEAGLDHGLLMGEHTRDRKNRIHIVSAQTVEKRGWWPDTDLLIVDEAHMQRRFTLDYIRRSRVMTIGLTATPFTPGLGLTYQAIVNAASTRDLLKAGWLSPVRIYAAEPIDISGAKVGGSGEWSKRTVESRALPVIGNIVAEWVRYTRQHFGGPVPTLLYAGSVSTGREYALEFQRLGYQFEQISYQSKEGAEARQEKIRALERGEISGLISCEALTAGIDIPAVRCVVLARPYRSSLAAVIQQIGRGMRAAPGKDYCLLLDHAQNYLRFADEIEEFWERGWDTLSRDGRPARRPREPKDYGERVCARCKLVLPPKVTLCPACGHVRQRRPVEVATAAGRLRRMAEIYRIRNRLSWARMQYRDLTGHWPGDRPFAPGNKPDPAIRAIVDSNYNAWRKAAGRK